jgi:hypothetical protein
VVTLATGSTEKRAPAIVSTSPQRAGSQGRAGSLITAGSDHGSRPPASASQIKRHRVRRCRSTFCGIGPGPRATSGWCALTAVLGLASMSTRSEEPAGSRKARARAGSPTRGELVSVWPGSVVPPYQSDLAPSLPEAVGSFGAQRR